MAMNVQPISTLSDRTNQIRLLTAEIVNREILPNENRLWVWRRDGDVSDSDKEKARELRHPVRLASKVSRYFTLFAKRA